jgi:FkbM family methyltransferase
LRFNRLMTHLRGLRPVVKTIKNWPTHVLDYLNLIPSGTVLYRLRNGVKIKTRAKTLDSMALREVWIYDEYHPSGFELAKDSIVLDIGGHIGCFAIRAARLAPNGKVYVFEPSPENFSLLQENIQLNAASNITPFNLALLGHPGTRQIALCPNTVSNSIVIDYPQAQRIDIQGISLSDFVKQQNITQIDFMKLDCEGAEYEIFFECPDDVLARIKKISAEVHELDEQRNPSTLAKFLESKGFQLANDPAKHHMLYARAR